jgi:hypothetical protein
MARVCEENDSMHRGYVCVKGYGKRTTKSGLVMLRAIDEVGCAKCLKEQGRSYDKGKTDHALEMVAAKYGDIFEG